MADDPKTDTSEKIRVKCPVGHIYIATATKLKQRGEKWACTTCNQKASIDKNKEYREIINEKRERDHMLQYYTEPE